MASDSSQIVGISANMRSIVPRFSGLESKL